MARAIEEYQIEQADAGEIAAMMGELSQLSDEEVKALLATEDDFTTAS
jgi:2-phospho-L-lactate guanylyltransferase (CobY/MobA/RfbA family)